MSTSTDVSVPFFDGLLAQKLKMKRDSMCTPEQRRHQVLVGNNRYEAREVEALHKYQYESGMSLCEDAYLRDDMPAYLRADDPPHYAMVPPGFDPEIDAHLPHRSVRIELGHPKKGVIPVTVPQSVGGDGRVLIHEEHYPSTERRRSCDYACGPLARAQGKYNGTLDGDVEQVAWCAYIIREYYDASGKRLIGKRILCDSALLCDRRDMFTYAQEFDANGRETMTWLRKGDGVTVVAHYNAEGARRQLVYSNGQVGMYAGSYGNERLLTLTKDPARSGGVVREFYAGQPGCAYLTRQVYEDGTIKFYTGTTPNFVTLSKVWKPDGTTELYDGDWKGVHKIHEGFEPRDGETANDPSAALVKAAMALADGRRDGATPDEMYALAETATDLAGVNRASSICADARPPEHVGEELAVQALAELGNEADYRSAILAHLAGISPLKAREAIEAFEGVQAASSLLTNTMKSHALDDDDHDENSAFVDQELSRAFSMLVRQGLLPDDARRVLDEAAKIAADTAEERATEAEVKGFSIEDMNRAGREFAQTTLQLALEKVKPEVKPPRRAPPPQPPPPPPPPPPPVVMRVNNVHERSDLHGKRVRLGKCLGECDEFSLGKVWLVTFMDAPVPKVPKGMLRWTMFDLELTSEEAWLSARAAKEAARAEKAESGKARRRALKLAQQLEADARLAAKLQAEEEEAVAVAARPGPPPEGKRALREIVRCPIDGALLEDAILCSDGFAYNKKTLQAFWHSQSALVSPVTSEAVTAQLLRHNPLRSTVKELLAAPAKGQAVPDEEPELMLCPISQDVMEAPVLAEDGYCYNRETLAQWFATGATTSPLTGSTMGQHVVVDKHMTAICRVWL